jgi:hypothetical protein
MESTTGSPQREELRGDEMRTADEVAAMLRLPALGWGTKRIAAELGCSRNTVKRYVEATGWTAYRKPQRRRVLDGLDDWLAERFRRHRGNADVVRQDLAREHGLSVGLRTVGRPWTLGGFAVSASANTFVVAAREAWQKLIAMPESMTSIGMRDGLASVNSV